MQSKKLKCMALTAAILLLSACATADRSAKESSDPTTRAITEDYVAPKKAPAEAANATAGFSSPVPAPAPVMEDTIVTTGARRRSASSARPPEAYIEAAPMPSASYRGWDGSLSFGAGAGSPTGRGGPNPQAGLLTAGDYDDVLNPVLYKSYLDKMLQGSLKNKELPYVDADQRINIRVQDSLGKPVPLAHILIRDADGNKMFPLRTAADGMTYLYPKFDVLQPGNTVSVSAKGAKSVKKTLTEDTLSGGEDIIFDLDTDRHPIEKLDLPLTIDATGSMGDEMRYLQSELRSIVSRVETTNAGIDVRLGLVVYRDHGDEYVVRSIPFTDDIEDFQTSLAAQNADGGGDAPEAIHTAMRTGLKMDWRESALKINLLVADAPPHDQDISDTWKTGLISRTKGIHIVPIAASGVDKTAEFLMRGMAQITSGRFLFLTDDSGIGNPHAEPTVDCYVVTRLDGLVTRVLNSLITGQRAEPEADDVIKRVGNYRAGICQLDADSEAKIQDVDLQLTE